MAVLIGTAVAMPPKGSEAGSGLGSSTGYYVINQAGEVFSLGGQCEATCPMPGGERLADLGDPAGAGADLALTSVPSAMYLLDSGGNVYYATHPGGGSQGDGGFPGFGTLSQNEPTGPGVATASGIAITQSFNSCGDPAEGVPNGMLLMDTAGRIFGYGTQNGHRGAPWPGFGTIFQREQLNDAGHPDAPLAMGLTLSRDNKGMYVVDSQGRIFGFGDAVFGVMAPIQPQDYAFQGTATGIMVSLDGKDLLVINSVGQIYEGASGDGVDPYVGNASPRYPGPFSGIANDAGGAFFRTCTTTSSTSST